MARAATEREPGAQPFDTIELLLQGGGALGAYETRLRDPRPNVLLVAGDFPPRDFQTARHDRRIPRLRFLRASFLGELAAKGRASRRRIGQAADQEGSPRLHEPKIAR
jgi:hypothetical protein